MGSGWGPVRLMADLIDGRKTVAAAGTAVQLASSQQVEFVVVQALSGNSNPVEVGASTTLATVNSQRGIRLDAKQMTPPLPVDDLADVWVDAVTTGEGVSFLAVTGP